MNFTKGNAGAFCVLGLSTQLVLDKSVERQCHSLLFLLCIRMLFQDRIFEYYKTKQSRNAALNYYVNSDFTVLFVYLGVEVGSLISCGQSNTWGRSKVMPRI